MYIIEGNIGVGKSTFLRLVSEQLSDVNVVFEPLNKWQDTVYGKGLLTNFYEDPRRLAYTFQLLPLICRVQDHRVEQEKEELTLI